MSPWPPKTSSRSGPDARSARRARPKSRNSSNPGAISLLAAWFVLAALIYGLIRFIHWAWNTPVTP
jgi:hypothetical protein